MIDDFEAVPPPYTSDDPSRLFQSTGPEIVHPTRTPRVNGDKRGIPSYEHAVGEDELLTSNSAIQYFDEHPAPQRQLGHGPTRHTLFPSSQSDDTLLQQRARYISSCGSRQYQGYGSRRRHCGKRTSGVLFLTAHSVEDGKNAQMPQVFPSSPSIACHSVNFSSSATNYHDLSILSESIADMKINSPSTTTSDLQSKHAEVDISLRDIKANLIARLTSSTPPSNPPSRSKRRALKSDLRALKHEIKAAVRQVKAERSEEARARVGRGCGKAAMGRQEKKELRRWKRQSLHEVREVERSVRRAGRGPA